MKQNIPNWEHTFIFSYEDINKAGYEQQQFYAFFKSEFLKGNLIDIKDNSNYAFVLLFDLTREFKQHKDYDLLYDQSQTLGILCPQILKYTNNLLLDSLYYYEGSDFLDIPKVRVIIQNVNDVMKSNSCISKPIDWILSLLRYKRQEEKNIYSATLYKIAHIFHRMGFGIAPDEDLDNIRLNFGDICIIYQNKEGKRSSKTYKFDMGNIFIRLSAYIIQAGQIVKTDYDLIDDFLHQYLCKDDSPTYHHLSAVSRWHIIYKKQRLERKLKTALSILVSSDQRKAMGIAFVQLAYMSKDVQYKRIERLEQVINLLDIRINDIQTKKNKFLTHNGIDLTKSKEDYHNCGDSQSTKELQTRNNLRTVVNSFSQKKIDEKLFESLVYRYRKKESISDHPIILEFINKLTNEFKTKRYVIKPIGWLFDYFNYSPISNKDNNIEMYEVRDILSILGLTVISGELSNDGYLKPNGICIIFDTFGKYYIPEPTLKKRTKKQIQLLEKQESAILAFSRRWPVSFLRRDEYKFIILYIQLVAKIIQEDKPTDSDYKEIDQFILNFVNLLNYNDYLKHVVGYKRFGTELFREYIIHYIQAYARFLIFSKKKQIFSNSMKKYVENIICSNQHNTIINSLIRLVCMDGNINSNRINNLEKILPVFGYDINNIHSDIHRILTDQDEFVTIEKTTNASEYSINTTNVVVSDKQESKVSIDIQKLQILEQQSQEARNMLSDIFVEDVLEENNSTTTKKQSISWKEILKILSTKQTWSRDEIANMCTEKGLILGAVLEQINDIAFEKFEDALVEDDGENIYVNLDYTQELL